MKKKTNTILKENIIIFLISFSNFQGDGPPPDPKYNFLADSERENDGSNNDSFASPVKDEEERRPRTKKDQGVWRVKRGGNNSSAKVYKIEN